MLCIFDSIQFSNLSNEMIPAVQILSKSHDEYLMMVNCLLDIRPILLLNLMEFQSLVRRWCRILVNLMEHRILVLTMDQNLTNLFAMNQNRAHLVVLIQNQTSLVEQIQVHLAEMVQILVSPVVHRILVLTMVVASQIRHQSYLIGLVRRSLHSNYLTLVQFLSNHKCTHYFHKGQGHRCS